MPCGATALTVQVPEPKFAPRVQFMHLVNPNTNKRFRFKRFGSGLHLVQCQKNATFCLKKYKKIFFTRHFNFPLTKRIVLQIIPRKPTVTLYSVAQFSTTTSTRPNGSSKGVPA